MAEKKLTPALIAYRHLDQAELNKDIRARITIGTPFWDYLTEERMVENFGEDEWERGIIEGARRFAGRLQDIVLDQGTDDAARTTS